MSPVTSGTSLARALPPDHHLWLDPTGLSLLPDIGDREAADAAPLARIYFPDVGGPMRTLFGMAHRHIFAINRDPKTNWPNPTEGVTERELAMRLATDPDVVDYQTQPCRIEMMVGGRLVSWIPDAWVLLRDGCVEFLEVKVAFDALDDPQYVAKLEAAFQLLTQLGYRGRVRYRDWIIGSAERQTNVAIIYADRAATIDRRHREAFRRLLTESPEQEFGQLIESLDPLRPMQGQAVAHRLICTGRVFADLDELLTDDSVVRLRGRARVANPLRVIPA